MINTVDAQRFAVLFKGKTNTYVKNQLPKKSPATGEKIKTIITNNEGTVDANLLLSHLNGDYGIGICPVNAEGKCYFGVIDIDYYKAKIKRVLSIISEYQLPLLPFRSKSGGLHIYLILSKSVSAKSMREALNRIIWFFCLDSIFGKNKVEVFPKQDKAEGFGSSVTLPYFNAEEPYTYLLDLEGTPFPFKEALIYIQKHFTTLEALNEVLDNLPFNDAPPCIQRILLSESVGADDSGRNNFIFSYAVYAKKKYGNGFEEYVREVNEKFECPLDEQTVNQTIASVTKNEYIYKCKDIPCNEFCDKPICHKREFGLGKDKGHFTGIDYGQLFRYKSEEPYYIWKLRLQGQEAWKDVIFRDEGFLLDQKNFAKMCVRYLNQAPMQVSNNDWYAILNSVLPHIQDVEVANETDTSKTAMLRNAFVSYLANKQARRDSPYQIRAGLCYRQVSLQDGNKVAKYYFSHNGFEDYLKNHKIDFDLTTMRETLKRFGAVEDTLKYETALGERREFNCWSKTEDDSISDMYNGNMEVENGDNASKGVDSISEASNKDDAGETAGEKSYTEEDKENAEKMF